MKVEKVMASFKEYDSDMLKRLQQALLEILLAVDKVCKNNNITYFLDSGSALGAIRHDGFIPWDDDIDIGMLRDDYESFMSIAQAELGNKFVVSNPRINKKQAALFGKVWLKDTVFETEETKDAGLEQGIFIDVFPYDVLNNNPSIATRQIRIGSRWQKISYLYHSNSICMGKGIQGYIIRACCKFAHYFIRLFLSPQIIINHFDKAIKLGKKDPSSNYVGLCYPSNDSFSLQMLLPTHNASFEGFCFPVPNDTNSFLINEFGPNWKDLPPTEQRKSHKPLVLRFKDN